MTTPADAPWAGIAVGRRSSQLALSDSDEAFSFANDDEGIAALLTWLGGRALGGVLLAAAGGFQRQLLAALLVAGHSAIAANLASLNTAVGAGNEAAAVSLASLGARLQPRVAVPADLTEQFRQWLLRREQELDIVRTEKHLLQSAYKGMRANIQRHIDFLLQSMRASEIEIKDVMAACPAWDTPVVRGDGRPG